MRQPSGILSSALAVVSFANAIQTIIINDPGVETTTRPDIPWPDYNSSDTITIVARDFKGCSPRTSYGDFCGWNNAWDNLWGIRDNICNHNFDTSEGAVRYVYNAWAGSGAAEIKAGMTSKYCSNGFSDILWNCFNSDRGPDLIPSTALSGTWDNTHEWYWLWGDEHFFARRNGKGTLNCCHNDPPDCINIHVA
ncbi:hypothetical protein O9K51_08695 [Purpureocillium lavendulum]|uniref:Secreted protein n=1 Tax=Purpureocillium lavendulum TaxID=1247861 RepID=A0AB34FH14_9HYPO|nr:hypothetical protein O9K51_08695 [Purpureocillium lavendulum]